MIAGNSFVGDSVMQDSRRPGVFSQQGGTFGQRGVGVDNPSRRGLRGPAPGSDRICSDGPALRAPPGLLPTRTWPRQPGLAERVDAALVALCGQRAELAPLPPIVAAVRRPGEWKPGLGPSLRACGHRPAGRLADCHLDPDATSERRPDTDPDARWTHSDAHSRAHTHAGGDALRDADTD